MNTANQSFEEFRINYGEGLTPTEQLLKQMGERGFLRFWSHANPHVTPSKELCDLLVICGDYVIVFSDKSIDFQFDKAEHVAWGRWYREAIAKSVRQLHGAVRHLFKLQSPIYKDRHCIVPMNIPIPPAERAKLFRVAVVSLSKEVSSDAPLLPFLSIKSATGGDEHTEPGATPFTLGDVSPDSEFVHVIDLAGLAAVLAELDTVTDFANYLAAREAFIRGQVSNSASSEWSLLTRYLFSFSEDGEPLPLDAANPGFSHLTDSERSAESTRAALSARKEANRESYAWDILVDRQAKMIEQQSFEFSTYNGVEDAERVVRYLALEPRLNRRLLGKAWKEACLIALPDQAANVRTLPRDGDGPTYVFLTVKQPDGVSYEEYRHRRRELLKNMVLASLIDFPASKVIIGIASELGQPPDSYDLLHFNVAEDANPETIQADAKACWNFKKRIFGDPRRSMFDERDVPPLG